jgi:REP element-mobilizing transposase RayT
MTADPQSEEPRKQRLRRLDRIFARSPIFFVTACSFGRRSLLANAAVHHSFVEFAQAGETHGAYVGAYVLMPDHLHLFVALEDEQTLASWMKSLKNSLSKAMRVRGISAPHWQKGFFDHVLRSDESYEQKWEYVRDNPVRAGLTKKWDDWSYRGDIWELEYRD